MLLVEVKINTINSFKCWIVKHYDKFNKNYEIIKDV